MNSELTEVILVNEADESIGTMEKMEAHRKPHLHRAFSIFLFDDKNRMLLQQRAISKYHSGGLWTNTCCSHPYPGEEVMAAAKRRLREEMGIVAELTKAFDFIYKADFDNGLMEHEYDHVYIGRYNGEVKPDSNEVASYCYKSMEEVKADLVNSAHRYTAWFKIAFPLLQDYLLSKAEPAIAS